MPRQIPARVQPPAGPEEASVAAAEADAAPGPEAGRRIMHTQHRGGR